MTVDHLLYGPNRRAVAVVGALDPEATPPKRWSRPTVARHPRGSRWGSLGLAYRSPLEGSARQVPVVPDLPPPVPAVGRGWHGGEDPAGLGRRLGKTRRDRPVRDLHRRHLRSGQKRGLCVGKTKKGKGTKIMAVADRSGLPIAVCIESASWSEVRLVEDTLEGGFLQSPPERLIGDKAYDSDSLDEQLLAKFGTEMIAPNRRNRGQTQDRRPLRRYRRRWKIERLFAWLYNFRRVAIRYEYHPENFLAMVQLAFVMILLRHL
jgi:transposase